jgi:hypothetical protein
MSVKHLYLVAVVAVLGCASSAANKTGTIPRSNFLTAEEIASHHADINTAYDAIARLRPNWLAPHGITSGVDNGAGTEYALVFVDGQRYGDINTLRGIPAYHVGNLRYYNVTEAGARFGIHGGSSGAIEVTLLAP